MKCDVNKLIRPAVRGISPYEPGKPVLEVRRELGLTDVVKMASNENPAGPSPLAAEAAAGEIGKINYYPDGSCFLLRKEVAAHLGVGEENLIFGNGSDEIIRMITESFLNDGEEAIVSEPSFIVYPSAVKILNGVLRAAKMKSFQYDAEAVLSLVSEKTKLVFFANPNNPTGTILRKTEADMIMRELPDGVITVFDEAYYEYVGDAEFPQALRYVKDGRPVVCLRTFSKIYGLAGLRIGYGITQAEMAEVMNRVRQPFNVNSLAQKAAIAALKDAAHVERSRQLNSRGKEYLYSELSRMGIEYVPSEANFILIKTGPGTAEKLLQKGIVVRGMNCYGLSDYIRVTIGMPGDNSRFVEALSEL